MLLGLSWVLRGCCRQSGWVGSSQSFVPGRIETRSAPEGNRRSCFPQKALLSLPEREKQKANREPRPFPGWTLGRGGNGHFAPFSPQDRGRGSAGQKICHSAQLKERGSWSGRRENRKKREPESRGEEEPQESLAGNLNLPCASLAALTGIQLVSLGWPLGGGFCAQEARAQPPRPGSLEDGPFYEVSPETPPPPTPSGEGRERYGIQ